MQRSETKQEKRLAHVIVQEKHGEIQVVLSRIDNMPVASAPGRFTLHFPEWRFMRERLASIGLSESSAAVGEHDLEVTHEQLGELGFHTE